jgi:hypothetical protein
MSKFRKGDLVRVVQDEVVVVASQPQPGVFEDTSRTVKIAGGQFGIVLDNDDRSFHPCLVNEHILWRPDDLLELASQSRSRNRGA